MDNPEILATLGTQDKGRRQTKQIQVRENRRGIQEWTIQTPATLGTQDEDNHNTTQKHKEMSNMDLTKHRW